MSIFEITLIVLLVILLVITIIAVFSCYGMSIAIRKLTDMLMKIDKKNIDIK